MNNLFENNGAKFSEDRKYRYALWRVWDESLPIVMIIGFNPSRATEAKNDNTITKVIKVARNNGYGGVYMMNLFAFITPYPEELAECKDPVGDNDGWLEKIFEECKDVVFAWGNFKEAQKRAENVIKMFPNALCFVHNQNGSPKHPLFCKDNTKFMPFKNELTIKC